MLLSLRKFALLGLGAAILAACADESQQPTGAERSPSTAVQPAVPRTLDYTTFSCANVSKQEALDSLNKLTPQLFKGGANGRRGRVVNLINDMSRTTDPEVAKAYADTLINITLQDYYAGDLVNQNNDLAGTQQRVVSFITYLYCYNSLSPLPDFDQIFNGFSKFIRFETPTTTVYDDPNQRFAGVKIAQGQVPNNVNGQPFYGTLVSVVRTTTELLPTDLDWYGLGDANTDGYKRNAYRFTTDPEVSFTSPVLTGVCVDIDPTLVDPADLRVAHGYSGTTPSAPGNVIVGNIEILAPQSVTPLQLDPTCTPQPLAAASFLGRTGQLLARLILPNELYARGATTKVGTSGSTSSFSPFASVDTKLAATGSGPSSPVYIPLGSTTTTAPVSVTVKSRRGQLALSSVGVSFAPSASFSPASASTNGSGVAASTWTLVDGPNTGSAAPGSSLFKFATAVSFSVTALQETTLGFDPSNALKDGTAGVPYLDTLKATGGIGVYSWSLTGLPAGLTFDANTGIISGTTNAPGSFTVGATVTSNAKTASTTYPLTIRLAPVTVTPASVTASVLVGQSYSFSLTAGGGAGSGTYTFAAAPGSTIPSWLSLSTSGNVGTYGGIVQGSASFTVRVTSTQSPQGGSTFTDVPVTITARTSGAVTLSYVSAPSKSVCYAVNQPISPAIVVRVTDRATGTRLNGVTVSLVAVTNNGTKVAVNPPSAVTGNTGSVGDANFGGPTINKTGGYALLASVGSVTLTSQKFTISPSCP
jgi:hypothetical protein